MNTYNEIFDIYYKLGNNIRTTDGRCGKIVGIDKKSGDIIIGNKTGLFSLNISKDHIYVTK